MAQVVEWFHRVDIQLHTLLAQQFHQLWIAAAALVAWHIERNHAVPPELYERLVDGRVKLLIQLSDCVVSNGLLLHSIPPREGKGTK